VSASGPEHDERLHVPLWWALPALGAIVLFGAELHAGQGGLRALLSYGGVAVVAIGLLLAVSVARVRVTDGRFEAGPARLPLTVAGRARALDRDGVRRLMGPDADPTAYVLHRAWIRGAVQVVVDDDADPTPYWLVSSRRPEQLLAAIERGRAARGAVTPGGRDPSS
jgi:hypothetical protein